MAAQIKTLSFLAYIIKIYQDPVAQHSSSLVKGVLGLLVLCPPEVAHLRKEILIAARYILQTDLRLSQYSCRIDGGRGGGEVLKVDRRTEIVA